MALLQHLKFAVKALSNVHRPGPKRDIFLFATPRGGSTWLMEIIASQPGMKFFDEPLSPRRANVAYSGLFANYDALMPGTDDADRIIRFLQDLQSGRRGYMNATPFQRNYRFLTNRAIFKIHEIEHLMDQVERRCNASIVYLLRHPIATSLSRHTLPRLDLFLRSDLYSNLLGGTARVAEIRKLASHGSPLQRAVISWCYENLIALSQPGRNWLFLTYEELVLNPGRSCDLLLERLDLPDRNAMITAFERPAANITMSHAQTIEAMSSNDARQRRTKLVTKWMHQVSGADIADAARVLSAFGVDAYDTSNPLPAPRHLHFEDTPALMSCKQN
jgi:Sulfotransferase family